MKKDHLRTRSDMRRLTGPLPFRIRLGGEAGNGIVTAGDILMRAVAAQGYESATTRSIPSNVRGGYSQSVITVSDAPVISPLGQCDILIALTPEALLHGGGSGGTERLVLYEASIDSAEPVQTRLDLLRTEGCRLVPVPFVRLEREISGGCALRSAVALGLLTDLLGIDKDRIIGEIGSRFGPRGTQTVQKTIKAFESGRSWADLRLDPADCRTLPPPPALPAGTERLILDGNESTGLGALYAGCTFYASYPITPATAIGEAMTGQLLSRGGISYQAEDEIAAIGTMIGASFNGLKAMTATSGPGLSLMQEFLGYASMSETALVIIDVQRAGPSTGMPTKHSQDDLLAAAFGGHGDSQRIVMAPITVEDCFYTTVRAFNCAERYRCPVIVLSDGSLGSTRSVIRRPDTAGIEIMNRSIPVNGPGSMEPSPGDSAMPGPAPVPGISRFTRRITGVEHDLSSRPVTTPEGRSTQMDRRSRKLLHIESEIPDPVIWDPEPGDSPADFGVCAWGFTAAVTADAVAALRKGGYRVDALYPRLLFPVCAAALRLWAARSPFQIVVESNSTGQYCSLAAMFSGSRPVSLSGSGGEPFTPFEIEKGIRRILSGRMKG